MGRDGRVIDLRVPTGREGGRRGGRGRESVWGAPMMGCTHVLRGRLPLTVVNWGSIYTGVSPGRVRCPVPRRLTAYLSYIRAYTRSRVPESCNIRVYLCVCSRVSYAIYSYAATRAVAYLASIWPRRGVDTRLHACSRVYSYSAHSVGSPLLGPSYRLLFKRRATLSV